MKIAILIGSPRKKDSYKVCQEIASQLLHKNPTIEFDYIFLNKHVIEDCKGCGLCFQKSELNCPCKNDELNAIKARLFSCDGFIISSPVYAYQVTAQLKRFIDRMSYQFHRQEMVAKPALIVVTTDGGGSKQVYKYLKMTLVGWG
ncbi:MAG: flavodoxin family protein, partial [Cellulosilyticaceae bacterium]